MEVEDADAHHGLFTVALPETIGRTIAGIARHLPSILRSTVKPAASISSTVARLQRQPSANRRHGFSSRSCQAASLAESARTCSRNRRRPPGLSMRLISSMTTSGRSTVHSTSVETTVSSAASGAGAPRRARRGRSPCACGGARLSPTVCASGPRVRRGSARRGRPGSRAGSARSHRPLRACGRAPLRGGRADACASRSPRLPRGRGRRRPRTRAPTVRRSGRRDDVAATVLMSETVGRRCGSYIASFGDLPEMAESGDRAQRRPSRLASATAAAREPLPSLRLMSRRGCARCDG